MSNEIVIELQNISKKYRLYKNKQDRVFEALSPFKKKYYTEFYALKNINLTLNKGDILGIVGRNGSGKSTLLKLISGIITPTTGKVSVKGNVVPLLELGSGFHPEFTGMENIYFYTTLLGHPRNVIRKKIQSILEFADLGEFIDQPIKNYSSGMRARLAFAVSVNIDPDILILDEILSVGDAVFKKKSHEKIKEFFDAKKTILFVSHSMESVKLLCNKAIMLDKGEIILEGDVDKVVDKYEQLVEDRKVGQAIKKLMT